MIPPYTEQGFLPRFFGDPLRSGSLAPYQATLLEVVERFGTTSPRRRLLARLPAFMDHLGGLGFRDGWLLLGGSFVTDCERLRGRPPKDIDVFGFLALGGADFADMPRVNREILPALQDRAGIQRRFGVDFRFVFNPGTTVEGLFFTFSRVVLFLSHDAEDHIKGLVAVSLQDATKAEALARLSAPAPAGARRRGS